MGSTAGAAGGLSAAGGTSIASIGLQAYSTLLQAKGVATADEYQADKLDTAAKYGALKADQTGAQITRSLNTTMGNIEAVRAAARADPNSPTGQVVLDNQEAIGVDQRSTTVNSILAQSRQDSSDALYYRSAAKDALLAGEVGAVGGALGSISKGLQKGGAFNDG